MRAIGLMLVGLCLLASSCTTLPRASDTVADAAVPEVPTKILVISDTHTNTNGVKLFAYHALLREQPDMILHCGDIVDRWRDEYWKSFDEIEAHMLMSSGIPVFPALGNHEHVDLKGVYPEDRGPALKNYFKRFPHLKGSTFYSVEHNNVLMLSIDTNSEFEKGSEQYDWIVKTLSEAKAEFIIAFMHHPPRAYNWPASRNPQHAIARDIFENEELGMRKPDIVFAGHQHVYWRTQVAGIQYVVCSPAGKKRAAVKERHSPYGFARLMIANGRLRYEWIGFHDQQRQLFIHDQFEIEKQP